MMLRLTDQLRVFCVAAWVCLSGCRLACAADITTIRHVLWDANQKPLFERCARDFEAATPGVRVRVQQLGWDDYWPALSTGFISGTAPDVFTNHASRFSEFALNGVMTNLQPLMARDGVDGGQFEDGLLALWQYRGGQYALPSDWDTIALVVNMDHARAAGISLAELQRLHWNPQDGGSLGRMLEKLTQDEQGRRLGEQGFNPQRVRVYGYQNPGSGGMMGQTEWSHYAFSAGWRYQDQPWDGALRYDDSAFISTLQWLASLPARGVSATPAALGRLGADAAFQAGRVAMVPSGAWMVGHFQRHAKFAHAWVPLLLWAPAASAPACATGWAFRCGRAAATHRRRGCGCVTRAHAPARRVWPKRVWSIPPSKAWPPWRWPRSAPRAWTRARFLKPRSAAKPATPLRPLSCRVRPR